MLRIGWSDETSQISSRIRFYDYLPQSEGVRPQDQRNKSVAFGN